MPFGSRSDDVTFVLQCCNLLANFRATDPRTNLDNAVRAMGMDLLQAMYFPQTANRPAGYVADDGTQLIWAFDGAQTIQHGQSYLDCTGSVEFQRSKGWASTRLADLALDCRDLWVSGGGVMRNRNFFTGHSFGGALATALMACLIDTDHPTDYTCITFGAPRAGGGNMVALLQHADIGRYMNDSDPVTILPPGRLEVGNYVITVAPRDLQRWSRFCHTVGGISINAEGVLSAAVTPANITIPQAISLARWIYTLSVGANSSHNLSSYINRMALAVSNAANARFTLQPKAPVEAQHVIPIKQAQQHVFQAEARLRPEVQHVENSHVTIPRVNHARIERSGRFWSVSFGGAIISSGMSKTNAKRLRDSLNTMLRRLQRQGMVDVATLQEQITAYLALASDPTSGFEPQLNNIDLG